MHIAARILADPSSPLAGVFDVRRVTELVDAPAATTTWLNVAHFLTPIVEMEAWMKKWGFSLV